jgi:MFS family permease
MYISEVAPARLRGRLASMQQLAIVLGLFGAFLSNYLLARAAGGAAAPLWLAAPAWRWMFWTEAAPAAVFLQGVSLIPEVNHETHETHENGIRQRKPLGPTLLSRGFGLCGFAFRVFCVFRGYTPYP